MPITEILEKNAREYKKRDRPSGDQPALRGPASGHLAGVRAGRDGAGNIVAVQSL